MMPGIKFIEVCERLKNDEMTQMVPVLMVAALTEKEHLVNAVDAGAVNNLIQGSDTTNRFRFEIPLPPGVSQGTYLTATATRPGSTSESSCNVAVDPPEIIGSGYEDPKGDAGLGDGQADGIDDSMVISTATNGSGSYSFSSIGNDTYWFAVESKEVVPSAGLICCESQHCIFNTGNVHLIGMAN